jgi:hypothetical protein
MCSTSYGAWRQDGWPLLLHAVRVQQIVENLVQLALRHVLHLAGQKDCQHFICPNVLTSRRTKFNRSGLESLRKYYSLGSDLFTALATMEHLEVPLLAHSQKFDIRCCHLRDMPGMRLCNHTRHLAKKAPRGPAVSECSIRNRQPQPGEAV